MRIIPPDTYFGCLLIDYRGSNLHLLNSKDGHDVKRIKIEKSLTLDKGQIEYACFNLKVYNKELLIALDGCLIYEIIKTKDGNKYNLITDSYINGFRTFKCSNQFIITTKLVYYNNISETDARQESFFLTLMLKNNKEINNLFI